MVNQSATAYFHRLYQLLLSLHVTNQHSMGLYLWPKV